MRKGHQKIPDSFKQIGQSVIHLDNETYFDEAKRDMSSGKEVGRGNKNRMEEDGDEDQPQLFPGLPPLLQRGSGNRGIVHSTKIRLVSEKIE